MMLEDMSYMSFVDYLTAESDLKERQRKERMTKLFLSLDDAVKVAVRQFDIDATLARQEFEQKCYISDDQYGI